MLRQLAIAFALLMFYAHTVAQEITIHPEPIYKCLAQFGSKVKVDLRINPYYLRGDFDGDGKPDYAVAVVMVGDNKLGVLICRANGNSIILGPQQSAPPFSDMPNDNFFSPNWSTYTKRDALEIVSTNSRKAVIKGEAIAMTWEDGIGLIYWDGLKFRWIGQLQ